MTTPQTRAGDAAFVAVRADDGRLARAEELAPANPFVTARFVASQRALGYEPWVLGRDGTGAPGVLTTAFVRRGRLRASCTLHSVPPVAADDGFWSGLTAFCAEQGITDLELGSAASPRCSIPRLPGEVARHARTEYLLDLRPEREALLAGMSRSHREWVRRAARKGVTLHRTADPDAIGDHVRLHNTSMERRLERGEEVALQRETYQLRVLVESGAGELFRAVRDGTLLSSLLVLRSAAAGYYYSSGNSPDGMACGASQFVTFEAMLALRAQGATLFNCSGARPHEAGLRDFKSRFGATPVELEAASFDLSTGLRRALVGAVDLARRALARSP